MRRLATVGIFAVCLVSILVGCVETIGLSADEIIENAIQANSKVEDFYGEVSVVVKENGEKINDLELTEFSAKDTYKLRVLDKKTGDEVVSKVDGNELVMYDPGKAKAYLIDLTLEPEHLIENNYHPKEQFKYILELTKDTHIREIIGEDTVHGFDTYHLMLKAKDPSSLFGDVEVWVEKKNWLMVKANIAGGNRDIYSEYTTIDFNPAFTEETFDLEIPQDIELEGYTTVFNKEITLEEAKEYFDEPMKIIESDEFILNKIMIYGSEEEEPILGFYYETEEGLLAFVMQVVHKDTEYIPKLNEDSTLKMRGHLAMGDDSSIVWDEGSFRYSIYVYDGLYSINEIQALGDSMK